LRKDRKKLVAVLGIVILVAILIAVYVSTRYITATAADTAKRMAPLPPSPSTTVSQVGECANCHEMKPEVLTWQVSAHEKFACTICHVDKKAANYQGKHESDSYSKPIKIIDAIPNQVCLQCHSANRTVSPAGDLKVPHQKHLDNGVACVKCHFGVVHGKIAERDLTPFLPDPTNFDAWNLDVVKKIATKEYIRPSMWTCIDCHKKANVTRQCSACHTTIPTLPSHDQLSWRTDHGKYARNDVQVCVNCHAVPGTPTFIMPSTGDKAADFARAQDFCYKCHTQRPEFHQQNMQTIHPSLVPKRGVQNCLTCHDAQQPKVGENVPKVFCNQCHWFNDGGNANGGNNGSGTNNAPKG